MEANRSNVLATILPKLVGRDRQGINTYPFETVWFDIVAYYRAGTLDSALNELSEDTGIDKRDAEIKVLNAAKGITPSTPATKEQNAQAVSAYQALENLHEDSKSSTESVKTAALAKLQKIVEQIKNDKSIVDEINKDEKLKGYLGDFTNNAADGLKLAETLEKIRFAGRTGGTLSRASLDKIEKFIVESANDMGGK